MASVPSLDKDLAKLRLGKYTPAAAQEVKNWIESTLGEAIGEKDEDLMDCLKDGVVLCQLANRLIPGSAKYKTSAMPFVQMENIALFLRVCSDSLKLPPHDLFLTVDLYEYKDPAQVLQTISAFSRIASSRNPSAFPTSLGPKSSSTTGKAKPPPPPKPSSNVTSWSKPSDEYTSAPAWNIHQYGYMGGASQGSQGVVMGGRRQITSAGPHVPSLKEKEARRKQEDDEFEARIRAAEAEEEREASRKEEELWLKKEREANQMAEARRLEEEARRRKREEEEMEIYLRAEQDRIRKREQQEAANEDRERRERQEKERSERAELARKDRIAYEESQQKEGYQEHTALSPAPSSESDRIRDLERQLEEARAREKAYLSQQQPKSSSTTPALPPRTQESVDEQDERRFLQGAWQENQTRPLPKAPVKPPTKPPAFTHSALAAQRQRELQDEDDAADEAPPTPPRHATPNQTPSSPPPSTSGNQTQTSPLSNTRWGFRGARTGSVLNKNPAANAGTMSIVQREMEMERQRQREWELNQQSVKEDREKMTDKELREAKENPAWDVNQYGYLGGANQGSEGVAFGRRREIIGPRGPR